MQLARRSTAYHHRNVQPGTLQLAAHVHHLLQRRSNQTRQTNHVNALLTGLAHYLLGRHHHAHVYHLIAVASHDHTHDVLTNVMHVALHRGQQHLAALTRSRAALLLDIRLQNTHSLLHRARRLHHLRQEHLALAKQLAHTVHPRHQRTLDNVDRPPILTQSLPQVLLQTVANALHQSLLQPLLHPAIPTRATSPPRTTSPTSPTRIPSLPQPRSQRNEPLRSTSAAVQDNILDHLQLIARNIAILHLHRRVDNGKVHPRLYGVIQEHRMHRLADIVVAPKRERQIRHAAADMCARQVLAYPARGTDEVGSICVVLLHTRGDGQDIRVKDNIQRIEAHLLRQQPIRTLGNGNPTLVAGGLPFLVEAHHHHGSTIALHVAGMTEEHRLALLQRNAVDDALALQALQACHNDIPVARVYHHRHRCYIRLGSYRIEKRHHLAPRIQQPVVHVHIEHQRTVGHLLAGYRNRLVVLMFLDETQELARTGHVAALAYHIERRGLDL